LISPASTKDHVGADKETGKEGILIPALHSVRHKFQRKTLSQRGFDYTRQNKCQFFVERGNFDYTRSAKLFVLAPEKYHCFMKN
jgi:hypothetical protein